MIQPRMAVATALTTLEHSRWTIHREKRRENIIDRLCLRALIVVDVEHSQRGGYDDFSHIFDIFSVMTKHSRALGEKVFSVSFFFPLKTNERLIDKFETQRGSLVAQEIDFRFLKKTVNDEKWRRRDHRNRSHKWICFEMKFLDFSLFHTQIFMSHLSLSLLLRFLTTFSKNFEGEEASRRANRFKTYFSDKFQYFLMPTDLSLVVDEAKLHHMLSFTFHDCIFSYKKRARENLCMEEDFRCVYVMCEMHRTQHQQHIGKVLMGASEVAIFHAAAQLSLLNWCDFPSVQIFVFDARRCSLFFPCLIVSSWIIDLKKSKCDSLASVRLFVFVQFQTFLDVFFCCVHCDPLFSELRTLFFS